jgi:fatty acid desaturase
VSQPNDDVQASIAVRKALMQLSERLRMRHAWLGHQDAIGLGLLLGAAGGVVALGWAFASGGLPAWLIVPLCAVLMSILHELEHDLIHRLYFKDRPAVYHFMMAVVWLLRPSTVSPWVRRDWHLHHHKASGTDSDLEERGITSGERWGLRRLLMTVDSTLSISLRIPTIRAMSYAYVDAQKPRDRAERKRLLRRNRLAYLPMSLAYAAWHGFLALQLVTLLRASWGTPLVLGPDAAHLASVLELAVYAWIMPNVLRSACLHFVSSNIHYYGDISPRSVVQQTQVWTSPWVWPFQLFCFNFGSTHAIHHFAVQDPFYVRQMIAGDAHAVMRAHGVRFNDFGTFRRANRYLSAASPESSFSPSPAQTA